MDVLKVFNKKNEKKLKNYFTKKNIPKLRYGMVHCRFGDAEGVSIVMKQVEEVLKKDWDNELDDRWNDV